MTTPGDPCHGWREWGGGGPLLHFAHANGLPPEAYRPLLEPLTTDFTVVTSEARPMWSDGDPGEVASWTALVHDLRHALDEHDVAGALGVGHSLGSVLSILAQAEDPGLFRGLVLIDPVLFTGLRSLVWGATKALGLADLLPLVHVARRRRDHWPDRAAVARSWRGKPVFASWQDDAFEAYVEAAVEPDETSGGVRLRYPRVWEARIFELTPSRLWPRLKPVTVSVLAIRGERSDTFLAGAARRLRRTVPSAEVITLAGASHFVPQEQPAEVVALIRDFVARRLTAS